MDPRLLYIRQRLRRRGGNPLASVAQDATSSKYVPASESQWSSLLSAAGVSSGAPSHLWLCQEASGNLADSIGSVTLTAGGSPGYQQTATGWSRKAVTIANGSTTDKFAATAGQGPDVSTTSVLWLCLVSLPTIPAALSLAGGPATYSAGRSFAVLNNGRLNSYLRNVNVTSANAYTELGVFPLAIQYDRTNSTALTFTHLEKITHSYVSTAADGAKGIGSLTGSAAPAMSVVYMAQFAGAPAEMSEANIKAMLQTMGFTIAW